MGASDEKLERCLAVLGGPTDEHKFAGLLMITKHLQDADAATLQEVRSRVLATTGVTFFLRLLHTKGCEDDALSPYRALALNLISSFCGDVKLAPEFAKESVVVDTLDALRLGVAGGNVAVVQDCHQVLQGLYVYSPVGRELLAQHRCSQVVIEAMRACCAVQPLDDSHEDVLHHLVALLRDDAQLWSALTPADTDAVVFCFGAIESASLAKVALQELLVEAPETIWTAAAVSSAAQGLFGAWPEAQHQSARRDTSLVLIDRLLSVVGGGWLLSEKGHQIVLVVQLAAIETKLLLDDAERAWIDDRVNDRAIEIVDGADDRLVRMIPVCYGILEVVVGWLAGPAAAELPAEAVAQLKDALCELFKVVAQFLTTARDFLATYTTAPPLDMVVYASVRVLGAWLAEDSDAIGADVVAILPFLLRYTPSAVVDDGASDADSDDEDEPPALVDPLHFLLPGLLQLTASDAAASAILDDEGGLARLLQFGAGVCANLAAGEDVVAVLTMCLGVHINLLLLGAPSFTARAQYQKTLPVFKKLLMLTCDAVAKDRGYDDDQYALLLHLINYCLLVMLGAPKEKTPSPEMTECLRWVAANPPAIEFEASYDLHELALHLTARYQDT
ncbi:hypothetical protein ACHHYP_08155 [Achlya hypogyna]|uniref:Neurochondrin n=1 Tax=Achlya hypogyna TaxID=1202772 RepID=A0A1V9ZLA1_ACHHY|nr:hypothetical protein ACHHYP_08155 [Achlya hypogyna]